MPVSKVCMFGEIIVDGVVQLCAATLARPRQLGPHSRTPLSRAISRSRSCRARPSSVPSSAKPAEMMSTDFAPFATQASKVGTTSCAGSTMPTRSGASGRSVTDG